MGRGAIRFRGNVAWRALGARGQRARHLPPGQAVEDSLGNRANGRRGNEEENGCLQTFGNLRKGALHFVPKSPTCASSRERVETPCGGGRRSGLKARAAAGRRGDRFGVRLKVLANVVSTNRN